jgi:hypothetical protein
LLYSIIMIFCSHLIKLLIFFIHHDISFNYSSFLITVKEFFQYFIITSIFTIIPGILTFLSFLLIKRMFLK